MILMLPVDEMRMFSILRSSKQAGTDQGTQLRHDAGVGYDGVLTSMDNRILVAVLQRAPNLPRELSRRPFPQSPMADDVVEHLTSAHVLGDHVEVVGVGEHLGHAADVRMMEDGRYGGLSNGSDLFRSFACDGLLDKGLGRRKGWWKGGTIRG